MTTNNVDVAHEGGLAGAYVPVSEDMAQTLLHQHYGFAGALKRFETEKDDTFRVTRDDGRRFVLKIANPSEPWAEVEFQAAILDHVAARDPALPVPRNVKNTQGRLLFVETLAGVARIVRVLSYIEGTPLCETRSSPSDRVKIGRMLARLRHATEGFSHPGAERVYAWDVQNLLTLEHLLDDIPDPQHRAALTEGMDRFRAIEPALRACRQQVLHNDFSKSNIVVDHANPEFVNGIIDFGDAVKTAIAVDVSTACLNQLPETPHDDLFHRARDVVEGYLQLADLTEAELRLIPHLTLARVVTRALISLWRARRFPENARYILRNTEQGWHQLDWFLARDPDTISDLLSQVAPHKGTMR